ncbi:MAG: isochorismatase family protein, partial [Planctomycetota bacterium]
RVVETIRKNGRKKLVIAALWTEVCANLAAIDALKDGYDVYVVTDASGGTTLEAHNMAVERMAQVGVVPVTWQQVMLEWQRDWANQETYEAVNQIVIEHSGAYGNGVAYAREMFGGSEGSKD